MEKHKRGEPITQLDKILLNSYLPLHSNDFFIPLPTVNKIHIPLKDDNNIPNGEVLVLNENSTMHNTIKKALEQGYTIETDKGKIFPK